MESNRIEGFMFESELALLYGMSRLSDRRKGCILEIGCYQGLSTSVLCGGLDVSREKLVCVDPFSNESMDDSGLQDNGEMIYQKFKENMERIGAWQYIEHHRAPADAFFKTFSKPVRMAFIDGSHLYRHVYNDISNTLALMPTGAWMVIDDYNWTDVKKATDELCADYARFPAYKSKMLVVIK